MGSSGGASEIVEAIEETDSSHHCKRSEQCFKLKSNERNMKLHDFPLDDDLNRIIEAIDLRISSRFSSPNNMATHVQQKDNLKKPVLSSGTGISDSGTLKQSLRRLCISQAREMAATKRLTKPVGISSSSEVGAIQRLYASMVVEGSERIVSQGEEKRNLLQVSLVPEKICSCEKASDSCRVREAELVKKSPISSRKTSDLTAGGMAKTRIKDIITPGPEECSDNPTVSKEMKTVGKTNSKASETVPKVSAKASKSTASQCLTKPALQKGACSKRNGKHMLTSSVSWASNSAQDVKRAVVGPNAKSGIRNEPTSLSSSSVKLEVNVDAKNDKLSKSFVATNSSAAGKSPQKINDSSRAREKGECSQSSKSSIGDYSSSTSISDDSHHSGSYGNGSRPHMSKDIRWVAIRHVIMQHGSLGLKYFKLIKKLGCGDIGTVYLAELSGSECLFALKVMDIEFLVSRKKLIRAQTEREILQMLDHPFLPTLYAHFTTDDLLCLVMEYCPGGDLHVLRQKQPGRCFSELEARFYVSEVLLALEYLHMLGVIYRDLKPENILVREDGHIMLSDFDLSLRCNVSPTLVKPSLDAEEPLKKQSGPCAVSSCIDPVCLQPDWVPMSCFATRLASSAAPKNRKLKADLAGQLNSLPQLIVEPTDARSNSFVGTHEYLAPEIIRGDGHGSSVDWWTLGIFLYELMFGRTPFKGSGHEETLANVISNGPIFPESPAVSFQAKDLIRGLLVKAPENRLGSARGAAEIKTHPFFEGLNWALIRCAIPPEVPRSYESGTPVGLPKKKGRGRCLDFGTTGENVEFELF